MSEDFQGDVFAIVYKLRKRLGWLCEGIQFGKIAAQKKTINTMQKEYPDDGKFVYFIDRNCDRLEARYNPYDLIVASNESIRTTSRYFTVSATYVTMVKLIVLFFSTIFGMQNFVFIFVSVFTSGSRSRRLVLKRVHSLAVI